MIEFYRTHRTLIVYDTQLDTYVPFTLEDKPTDLHGLISWWCGRTVQHFIPASPEIMNTYKALGMVQIGVLQ